MKTHLTKEVFLEKCFGPKSGIYFGNNSLRKCSVSFYWNKTAEFNAFHSLVNLAGIIKHLLFPKVKPKSAKQILAFSINLKTVKLFSTWNCPWEQIILTLHLSTKGLSVGPRVGLYSSIAWLLFTITFYFIRFQLASLRVAKSMQTIA